MKRWQRWLVVGFSALGGAVAGPRVLSGADAQPLFDGDVAAQTPLADSVATRVDAHAGGMVYASGLSRFDGQSAVAIYQMTLLGLGQVVQTHPELRERYLPAMRKAARELVRSETLSYAADRYGEHGAVKMDPGEGHAYLGAGMNSVEPRSTAPRATRSSRTSCDARRSTFDMRTSRRACTISSSPTRSLRHFTIA